MEVPLSPDIVIFELEGMSMLGRIVTVRMLKEPRTACDSPINAVLKMPCVHAEKTRPCAQGDQC